MNYKEIVRQAYEKAKGDAFTYIRDVRGASGLPNDVFDLVITCLASDEVIELVSGFEGWDAGSGGGYTDRESNVFLGMNWIEDAPEKEPLGASRESDVFRKLYPHMKEIAVIAGTMTEKNSAAETIQELFAPDLPITAIKTHVIPLFFLNTEIEKIRAEHPALRADININIQKDGQKHESSDLKEKLEILTERIDFLVSMFQGSGNRAKGSGRRVQGTGRRVQGSGRRALGSGDRAQDAGRRGQGAAHDLERVP